MRHLETTFKLVRYDAKLYIHVVRITEISGRDVEILFLRAMVPSSRNRDYAHRVQTREKIGSKWKWFGLVATTTTSKNRNHAHAVSMRQRFPGDRGINVMCNNAVAYGARAILSLVTHARCPSTISLIEWWEIVRATIKKRSIWVSP